MHRQWFSSSGKLRALWLSVGACVCSGVVGDEANAEESAALDDRLGMGGYGQGRIKVQGWSRGIVVRTRTIPGMNIEGRSMAKQGDLSFSQN